MCVLFKMWICLVCVVCLFSLTFAMDVEGQTETERQVLRRAQKELRNGNAAESEIILHKYLENNPTSVDAKLSLSYVFLKQKRYFDSHNLAFEVAKLNNKNAKALALIGFTFLNSGDFKQANLYFFNANLIDKRESLAWEGAGLVDFYENKINTSLEKLRQAVFLESKEPDFFYTLAQVAARNENYLEAANNYRSFLQVAPRNDVSRRDKIRGLIDFLEYLGSRSSLYDLSGADQSTVPIEIVKQRPIIKVRIGRKKREYNFVLDTGSSVTVLSEKTAKEIGIKPVASGGQASAIGGNGKFNIVYGFLNTLEIGETKVRNVPIYIRKFHEDAEQVDGFIGLAVISRYLTTLDYGNLTLTLAKRDDKIIKRFSENEVLLPLRLTTSGFLSGEIFIEGLNIPLYFIVDTGASISVISSELAVSNELSKFASNDKMRVVGAGGVIDGVQSFILPKISFGKHSRESIQAIALNLNLINENSGFSQNGILGGNFLQNYKLTFDFKGSKIAFLPNNK
jgi:predicted aspartyl protease/Tfp pilus assembly protein PilF